MKWLDGITNSVDMGLGSLWQSMGISDGQLGLACCGPWGLNESDMIERLK